MTPPYEVTLWEAFKAIRRDDKANRGWLIALRAIHGSKRLEKAIEDEYERMYQRYSDECLNGDYLTPRDISALFGVSDKDFLS